MRAGVKFKDGTPVDTDRMVDDDQRPEQTIEDLAA